METQKTQKTIILEHLERYGSSEPLTALRDYGVYRLSAVIFNLKRDGHDIITKATESVSRITGRPVHYVTYILNGNGEGN